MRPKSRGVTLIEILVATSILAILVGLTLSALSWSRESARRTQCVNRLRQIGIATQLHVARTGRYPLGNNPNGYSFLTVLLPDLEEVALFNAINLNEVATRGLGASPACRTVAATTVAAFLCPSDPAGVESAGRTNYAGNRGGGVQKHGYNGAFGYESKGALTPADFSDGASWTVLASEWLLGTFESSGDPRRPTFRTPTRLDESTQLEDFAEACRRTDPASSKTSRVVKGQLWFRGELSYSLYNHVLTPNGRTCLNQTSIQTGAWTAGSGHSGGVNCGFVDGHVEFVKSTIDLQTWRSLASRAGGEAPATNVP